MTRRSPAKGRQFRSATERTDLVAQPFPGGRTKDRPSEGRDRRDSMNCHSGKAVWVIDWSLDRSGYNVDRTSVSRIANRRNLPIGMIPPRVGERVKYLAEFGESRHRTLQVHPQFVIGQ